MRTASPPSYVPLNTSIGSSGGQLSPRLPASPRMDDLPPYTSPNPSSSPHTTFVGVGVGGGHLSAADEKRAIAAAAELQADLDRRRAAAAMAAHPSSPSAPAEEEHSRATVLATVVFYLVAAIVMVFANKWVLNAVSVPLTFLLFQLVIAVILLHLFSLLGYFALPRITLPTTKALSPLIGINVVGLTFNTYCLQYVDASFYQVARGLILPFTVLASWAFLSAKPSLNVLSSVGLVCLGFFCGVGAEHMTVSTVGVVLGVFSSVTTSVHAIVVKRSLAVTSDPMDLAYYNNLLSALALLPAVLVSGETRVFTALFLEGGEALRTFVLGAVVTGVFGFLICIAGFLSIKVTSPVTHMISSAVRGVIQTLLGVAIFSDVVSWGRGLGIGFILLGSIMYTWVKDREATRAAKERREREAKDREALFTPGSANTSTYPSPNLASSPRNASFDESREKRRMD